ncbi:MAG: uroporphyrinogen-III C-methyltransferase [Deltaproteobacteria bacterium]|nr:uroporphyrinogen-III C-methyltransferase [Deltaproteobacteria bacterium]
MKVFLIGAGPGDPGLVTLKACRIIPRCDVIVYDDLIPLEILSLAKPGAEKRYVGKRGGKAHLKQSLINELLVELALQGKTVARLKGGDPCIFGRGGEEALYLKEHGIPFEIVPGITSAIAGPVSAGIPPTHRGYASSVKFVTAHEDLSKESGFLDWKHLAAEKGTLVLLMGASRIKEIADKLVQEGMSPETPCALVQGATTPLQRRVVSTLARVGLDAREHGIGSPCIIVVGAVVSLSEELFNDIPKPLAGRTVLITRPSHLALQTASLFVDNGAKAVLYPLLDISALPFDLPDMNALDLFIFTSQNAVPLFMHKMLAANLDARSFGKSEIYCIGPKTRDALLAYGIRADGMADEYRAEGIVEMLKETDLSGKRVCLPRARGARGYLVDALRERGAEVLEIPVYETVLPKDASKEGFLSALAGADTVVFTSPSGIRHAVELLGDDRDLLRPKRLAAIGPVTAGAMQRLGLPAQVTAHEYTDEGIIGALKGESL